MDYHLIIIAGSFLGVMGLVFGVGLAIAAKKFAVEVDPRITQVREALPGANCGACGYPGCDGFASAVVAGDAPANGCPVGGNECAVQVAAIMGIEVSESKRMVAHVMCKGNEEKCSSRYEYQGYASCTAAAALSGGPKSCQYGCMGLGSCVEVCAFDAIHIVEGKIAEVEKEKCTGCLKCVEICPKHVISMIPYDQLTVVECSNMDIGGHVKKNCDVACIACRQCERNCPKEAIHVNNNVAMVDPEKCVNCGICVNKCPTKAILGAYKR